MSLDSPVDRHPHGFGPRAGSNRRHGTWWLPYLVAVLLVVLVQGAMIGLKGPPALEGRLHGTDGYLRLVRVAQLYETGDWFDRTIARSNAPYGTVMHWTRPMDLLLLGGGLILSPRYGFRDGLHRTAVFLAPVLYLAMVLALVWMAAPLLDLRRRCLLVMATLVQVPLLTIGSAGHADHHMLISLSFVLAIGLNLRLLLAPSSLALALAAGASLGFALWVSMEGLILLAVSFAALTVAWLLHGGARARANLCHALGFGAMTALAVAAERLPAEYLTEEYDRISIVHFAVAGLAAAFWAAGTAVERRAQGGDAKTRRWVTAGLGACACALLLSLMYPKFFGGPEVDVDPRLRPILYDVIAELQPLVPLGRDGLGDFLIYLGPALVCVPFLVWLLCSERRKPAWEAWLYLAICLGAFLALALAMRRFAPFAGVLLAVVLAELLGRLLVLATKVNVMPLRAALRAGLPFALLTGFTWLGWTLIEPAQAKGRVPGCALHHLIPLLNDPEGLGRAPRLILAHVNHGPQLLYRTAHAVVATPYHRNVAGNLDANAVLGARNDDTSRRLVEQRGVDLILICGDGSAVRRARAQGGPDFAGRLATGDAPPWLRRVDAPPAMTGGFLLFEVVR